MFKQALIGSGVISTFATLGVGAFWYFNSKKPPVEKNSIDKLFSKLGGKIKLTKEDKYLNEWAERWGKYITANTTDGRPNDKDIWGLEDWATAKQRRDTVPKSFADKCEDQLKLEVKDDKDPEFSRYVDWCTK